VVGTIPLKEEFELGEIDYLLAYPYLDPDLKECLKINCFLTTYHSSFMVHWWVLVHS
jgi:hypothetical protein